MRKSLKLTVEQWQILDNLAEQTNSTATTGTTAGEPSWRALIRRIADKEVIVDELEPAPADTKKGQSND